jgi:hypothetical protein
MKNGKSRDNIIIRHTRHNVKTIKSTNITQKTKHMDNKFVIYWL